MGIRLLRLFDIFLSPDALEQISVYAEILQEISSPIQNLQSHPANRPAPSTKSEISKQLAAGLDKTFAEATLTLNVLNRQVLLAEEKAHRQLATWEKTAKFLESEQAYKNEIKKKGLLQEKESARRDLADTKQKQEQKLKKSQRATQMVKDIRKKREALLDELSQVSTDYSNERIQQAEAVTLRSSGKLKIAVKRDFDSTKYVQTLLKLKVGSQAERQEIEGFVDKLSAKDLIELVLDGEVDKLKTSSDISEQIAKNIISELGNNENLIENLIEALALQYRGRPDDQIDIRYRKKDGNYYPLSEISMGQKADALVMIALGDGTAPVIIDQPEDALDIPSMSLVTSTPTRLSF